MMITMICFDVNKSMNNIILNVITNVIIITAVFIFIIAYAVVFSLLPSFSFLLRRARQEKERKKISDTFANKSHGGSMNYAKSPKGFSLRCLNAMHYMWWFIQPQSRSLSERSEYLVEWQLSVKDASAWMSHLVSGSFTGGSCSSKNSI